MNPENLILSSTEENCCSSKQNLGDIHQNNQNIKTEGESTINPESEEKQQKEKIKRKIKKKKRQKNLIKKSKAKKCLNNQRSITTHSSKGKYDKEKEAIKENKKRVKKRYSYYFRKKSRIKINPKLSKDKCNNFGGSQAKNLIYLGIGSLVQERKYYNNNFNDILWGTDGEVEIFDFNRISVISFNYDYKT